MRKIKTRGVTAELTEVDATLAKHWLGTQEFNRNLRRGAVTAMAGDMLAGRWKFDGAPIRFDQHGHLIDGQHRLSAVIESNTSQEFLVIDGISAEAQIIMDSGAKRTAADQFHMTQHSNSTARAAAIRLLLRVADGSILGNNRAVTTMEVVGFNNTHQHEMDLALSLSLPTRRMVQSTMAVSTSAAYLALNSRLEAARDFFGAVTSGANLPPGSPILALIQGINGRKARQVKMSQCEELYYWVQAFNKWRGGKSLLKLQLPTGDGITLEHLVMR